MEKHSVCLKSKRIKALFHFILLVLLVAFLSLGWTICSGEMAVIRHDLFLPVGSANHSPKEVLNLRIPPKSPLFAQEKGNPPKEPTQASVIVNGTRLSDEKVKALEKQYGVRILPGDYWYDRVCGAWGYRGGPAAGIILPFLDIGGPLSADASYGNTGVFINGRQLHVLDVVALQQITHVYQGRYWVDSQGNIGLEGGPALINLWILAISRGVKKEGILSTYDKTGAAVLGY